MDFNEHYNRVLDLVVKKYPELDFVNDYDLNNKVCALSFAITKRLNDPAPPKPEKQIPMPIREVGWDLKL